MARSDLVEELPVGLGLEAEVVAVVDLVAVEVLVFQERGLAFLAEHTVILHAARMPAQQLVDELAAQLRMAGQGEDDIALLAVQFTQTAVYRAEIADASSIAPVRHDLARWLQRHDVPAETSALAVLAMHEAAANSIEHAYKTDPAFSDSTVVIAAPVSVCAYITEERTLTVSISDQGQWQERPLATERGRGLQLMNAFADVRIDQTITGTTITLERSLAATDGTA